MSTVSVPIGKVDGRATRLADDMLAVEEPLEIRVNHTSLSITMRTPGHDFELAAGFLFSEGILTRASQLGEPQASLNAQPNIVDLSVSNDVLITPRSAVRAFMMTSACGMCGKVSLESLESNPCPVLPPDTFRIDSAILHQLPGRLRKAQSVFESTGGLHAAALFNGAGELEAMREDVGRHNAVDKLIGNALLRLRLPLRDSLMLVSGRASFELVQKAVSAGVPIMAAVGAPSSLAVSTAERCGMTLIGFLREGRFNLYSGAGRIVAAENAQ